jgi:DNA-binding response OmpR family regulator
VSASASGAARRGKHSEPAQRTAKHMSDSALELTSSFGFSRTEQAIFARLAADANALVKRADLLAALRGNAPHTIDSHIMAIRRKLAQGGSELTIETVKGAGFILRA